MRPQVLRRQVMLVGLGLVATVTAATVWMLAQGTRGGVIAAVMTVVLGEPGAGKTVLALQLVIDLAAAVRAAADTEPLPRVPVRLSLPAFDPGDTRELDETPAGVLAARLNDWVIQHVVTVHGIAPKVATALVADGWILPVLDGLDEMDPDASRAVHLAPSTVESISARVAEGICEGLSRS